MAIVIAGGVCIRSKWTVNWVYRTTGGKSNFHGPRAVLFHDLVLVIRELLFLSTFSARSNGQADKLLSPCVPWAEKSIWAEPHWEPFRDDFQASSCVACVKHADNPSVMTCHKLMARVVNCRHDAVCCVFVR